MTEPPLLFLHQKRSLIELKLIKLRERPVEELVKSLQPGSPHSLKARPDGTVLDGHHRLLVLKERGVDIERLPRELVEKKDDLD